MRIVFHKNKARLQERHLHLYIMNIPNFELLVKKVEGIKEALTFSDDTILVVSEEENEWSKERTLKAGILKSLLQTSRFDIGWGWEFVFPDERPNPVGCYRGGISACCGEPIYWKVIAYEPDYQI